MARFAPIVLAILVASLVGAASLQPARYEVASGSRFWIDGTATTGEWTCEADDVHGYGILGDGLEPTAEVNVSVRDLDCGSGLMNRDMYAALRADANPHIQFVLEHAELLDGETQQGRSVRVRTTGMVRLAGAARRLSIVAEGQRLQNGRVAIRGSQSFRMSDFGVAPPSHALGLVRAHDSIVARFDLVAAPR